MERIEQLLKNVATMNVHELADFIVSLGEDYPNLAEDPAALAHQSRLIAVVDAIGELKFPGEWREQRDAA